MRWQRRLRERVERAGFAAFYRLAALQYALGVATPKRTVAGRYWSYEPTNPHGDEPGLAALDRLASDAVVYDVGAHVGEYAVALARDTDRQVVAFEPNPTAARRLERTVARNGVGDRLRIHRIGLGEVDALRPFYRSSFSKCSSLNSALADRPGAAVDALESIPVRRLDTIVDAGEPPPDGIKVDVEGGELAVLAGGERTIRTYRPLLVVEPHGREREAAIREWLADRGYVAESAGDGLVARPPESASGSVRGPDRRRS